MNSNLPNHYSGYFGILPKELFLYIFKIATDQYKYQTKYAHLLICPPILRADNRWNIGDIILDIDEDSKWTHFIPIYNLTYYKIVNKNKKNGYTFDVIKLNIVPLSVNSHFGTIDNTNNTIYSRTCSCVWIIPKKAFEYHIKKYNILQIKEIVKVRYT